MMTAPPWLNILIEMLLSSAGKWQVKVEAEVWVGQ